MYKDGIRYTRSKEVTRALSNFHASKLSLLPESLLQVL